MNSFLLSIINFFYGIVPNYGVAIILFTLFVKLCLSPLDLKSRRSMRRMSELNPKVEELKKKYANDREKLNQKTQELYQKEKVNPMAGCLPMLLTLPILFAMFGAMRSIANDELVKQYLQIINGQEPVLEPFLWIRNLWMPDNVAASIMPNFNALRAIGQDVWVNVSQTLEGIAPLSFANADEFKAYIDAIPQVIADAPAYQQYLQTVPQLSNINLIVFNFSVFVQMNGYYVLPLLCVASTYLSQKLMPTNTTAPAAPAAGGQQAANPGKTMMMMMPLMSLWFCTTSSAAFALYWVTSNITASLQQYAFTRYFDLQDRKAAIAEEVGIK